MSTNLFVFTEGDAFTDVLGQSSMPCPKDRVVYDSLSASGAVNILNETDRVKHSRIRRLVSHGFSTQALLESEPLLASKVDQFVDSTMEGRTGQVVDIGLKTYELYLDIVSQLSFGESFGTLCGKNPTAAQDVQGFFVTVPPMIFNPWLRYLSIKTFQEGLKGLARLEAFSTSRVLAYLQRAGDRTSETDMHGKFLQNMATAVDAETGTKMTRIELIENAIIFLTAGTGTTSTTITYVLWECGRNERARKDLIREIREAFPDVNVMPSYAEASKLKLLGNVIEETLRLWGPGNIPLTRVSPGKTIAGHWVPHGISVEVSSYATARNARVFAEPLKFDPYRWENATPEMRCLSRPFSTGPRNCVGRHLAEIGLRLAISRISGCPTCTSDGYTRARDR
ncbi:cytochrome P450 [Cadophora sp. DSE1049]|nr:cytochrome P450 [Cadophora sp. DSE1049]